MKLEEFIERLRKAKTQEERDEILREYEEELKKQLAERQKLASAREEEVEELQRQINVAENLAQAENLQDLQERLEVLREQEQQEREKAEQEQSRLEEIAAQESQSRENNVASQDFDPKELYSSGVEKVYEESTQSDSGGELPSSVYKSSDGGGVSTDSKKALKKLGLDYSSDD
ncbi:hypothetical protein GOV04_01560 [Candidatus Woesearchaeota archaeon]|nr:hypothetical protein [Candidatus Woesearchaeota archaeon]